MSGFFRGRVPPLPPEGGEGSGEAPAFVKQNATQAILGIDPGGTTGVAAGYFDLRPTRKETIGTLRNAKSAEVEGSWLEQGVRLAEIINKFVYTANVENSIPLPNISVAIEDFILRRREAGGATGNLTSVWVAAAMMGAYVRTMPVNYNVRFKWQQPSSAKNLATDARLKDWGLWVKGSAHKRDAWRHIILRLDELII